MDTRSTIDLVLEFHEAFELQDQIAAEPCIPADTIRLLWIQCLVEEVGEFAHALGKGDLVEMLDALTDIQYFLDGTYIVCGLKASKRPSLIHLAPPPRVPNAHDSLHLIEWLLSGTLAVSRSMVSGSRWEDILGALNNLQRSLDRAYVACGMYNIKLPAFQEVHRTNMAKLHDGRPVRDASGRVVKPEGWQPPFLGPIILGALE